MMRRLPERYLRSLTSGDLTEKMVFIGGPRQVGKTTFALSFLVPADKSNPSYFNWDINRHRKAILHAEFGESLKLIVLDEVHKYARWRNLTKGFYDEYYPKKNFLVTGSARLDHYRKGGDSLLGRYHYQRLHPFSLPEISHQPSRDDIDDLLQFGGFPEPLFKQDERFSRRWRKERHSRILKEDVRDLETVREVSLLEILLDALPERVGSPLSVRSFQEDLQVSHETIARWLVIFENVYLTYRIAPFGAPRIRAIKKEQKLYFWDWSVAPSSGARFENMIASLLLKYCHFLEDSEGQRMELRYLRDRDGREVDFVVLKDRKPIFAVECKTGDKSLSNNIAYFAERTTIPLFYQVHLGKNEFVRPAHRAHVLPFAQFCSINHPTIGRFF